MLAAALMRLQLYTSWSTFAFKPFGFCGILARAKCQKNACNTLLPALVAANSLSGACASLRVHWSSSNTVQARAVYQASAALGASEPGASNKSEAMSRDAATPAATHAATHAAQPSAASSAAVIDDACCFDCGAACGHDRWLCATHNVSLCIDCAGVHRALGAGISFVRSERLDGCETKSDNAVFAAFLEAHGVPRRDWLAAGRVTRYYTPVADLWRRRSDATARLRAVEPPDPELVKRYEAAKAPAIWTPDKDAPTCQLCRRKFSYYYRRHHCRACGRCVCCDCSPKVCWQTTSRRCKRCVPPPARSIPGLLGP